MGIGKAGITREFLAAIKRHKLNYFGHVMRKPAAGMEKNIIQKTKPKQWKRVRRRTSWLHNITAWFVFLWS